MFNWRGEERDSGGIGEVEGKYGIGKEGLSRGLLTPALDV